MGCLVQVNRSGKKMDDNGKSKSNKIRCKKYIAWKLIVGICLLFIGFGYVKTHTTTP